MSKQNDVGTPSGARKAALLLLSLGKEEAARVMSHLDDKMIEEIVLEMSQIRVVSKDQKEGILNEFKDTISKISIASRGGLETAKEILSNSLGQHRADEILGRITKKDIDKDFEFLNEMEPSALSGLLGLEAPQTIAVALAFIQPKKAAEVMKFFPTDIQSKIALKLAVTSRTHPDAIMEIAKVLKKKYEAREKSELSEAGGAQSLANILNHMDKSLEDSILKELSDKSPEIASQVREKLYIFEDILNLDHKEMRTLIGKIPSNEIMALALRGAGEDMRKNFFQSMSQNRASDIIEAMESRGRVSLREINDARNQILNTARVLEDDGSIVIKKGKEEFI